MKYDIFHVGLIVDDLFEAAMLEISDKSLVCHMSKSKDLKQIIRTSILNNLTFLIENKQFQAMESDDFFEYSYSSIFDLRDSIIQMKGL